jgi:hypothetical protein
MTIFIISIAVVVVVAIIVIIIRVVAVLIVWMLFVVPWFLAVWIWLRWRWCFAFGENVVELLVPGAHVLASYGCGMVLSLAFGQMCLSLPVCGLSSW